MSNFLLVIVLIISNYLVGSISSAKLIARYKGRIDISKVGFKTAGGSNVAESVGIKWGILVGAIDVFKGVPILLISKYLKVDENWQCIIALATIVGHCWPIWFKFTGGRGLATFFGTGLILYTKQILLPLVLSIISIPMWYLRKYKNINVPLLSSPTLTLAGLIVFVFLALRTSANTDDIFGLSVLAIMLLRRVTARTDEYKQHNFLKLFFSRLIFDSSNTIK